jgi:cytochrome c-type biogenesis protein CcmH
MKRVVWMWLLCAGVVLSHAVWAGEAQPLAEDPKVEARLVAIAEELRCLVCQNESLASSHAELAEDLRREVRKLIRQDMSDAQIKTYLVDRYGDFVLYRPPVKPLTWPLWFGPFALLFLAVIAAVGGPLVWVPIIAAPFVIVAAVLVQPRLRRHARERKRLGSQLLALGALGDQLARFFFRLLAEVPKLPVVH